MKRHFFPAFNNKLPLSQLAKMGQDTCCDLGVTFRCEHSPENSDLITRLLKMKDITVYIYRDEDDDQVVEVGDVLTPENLFNEKQFSRDFKDENGYTITLPGKELIFKRNVYRAHAYNLRRRETEDPVYDEETDPLSMISVLQQIIADFKTAGADPNDLKIGHLMSEF